MPIRAKVILLFLLILPVFSIAQEESWRVIRRVIGNEIVQLDSLSIYPNTFEVRIGEVQLSDKDYLIDYFKGTFLLKKPISDTLDFKFQVFPFQLSQSIRKRDDALIYNQNKGDRDLFKIENKITVNDLFGGVELNKKGSISRGVSFGNNQDLGINSSLNLELNGELTPNLKVLASVSDANLPIQPDGNTNKLQEFDTDIEENLNVNTMCSINDIAHSEPIEDFFKMEAASVISQYNSEANLNVIEQIKIEFAEEVSSDRP